jgi:hypothetical protein
MTNQLKVTVSGSFRRHLAPITTAVETFTALGCRVLSPEDPRVVDSFGEFLFVASDRFRTIRTVQNRHLAAIGASHFLWLVDPDGYVGQSASMELGFAVALGIPIMGDSPPSDLTLRQYVTVVASERAAVDVARRSGAESPLQEVTGSVLLDPTAVTADLHSRLDRLEAELVHPVNPSSDDLLASIASGIGASLNVRRERTRS